MSNSAWSGNTAGLASAVSPGLVGTSTQTFAGKKTLDGGALIKGDTSGVAINSNYVGAIGLDTIISITPVINSWTSGATFGALPAGFWMIYGRIYQASNRTTNIAATFATNNNNDGTGLIVDGPGWDTFAPASTGTVNVSFQAGIHPFYYPITSPINLYPKVYAEGSGTGSIQFRLLAIRIS